MLILTFIYLLFISFFFPPFLFFFPFLFICICSPSYYLSHLFDSSLVHSPWLDFSIHHSSFFTYRRISSGCRCRLLFQIDSSFEKFETNFTAFRISHYLFIYSRAKSFILSFSSPSNNPVLLYVTTMVVMTCYYRTKSRSFNVKYFFQ